MKTTLFLIKTPKKIGEKRGRPPQSYTFNISEGQVRGIITTSITSYEEFSSTAKAVQITITLPLKLEWRSWREFELLRCLRTLSPRRAGFHAALTQCGLVQGKIRGGPNASSERQ
jgi:hypothetical protein